MPCLHFSKDLVTAIVWALPRPLSSPSELYLYHGFPAHAILHGIVVSTYSQFGLDQKWLSSELSLSIGGSGSYAVHLSVLSVGKTLGY
jgi:hypothetical protein